MAKKRIQSSGKTAQLEMEEKDPATPTKPLASLPVPAEMVAECSKTAALKNPQQEGNNFPTLQGATTFSDIPLAGGNKLPSYTKSQDSTDAQEVFDETPQPNAQKVFDKMPKWQSKNAFLELSADNQNPNMGMKLTYTATEGNEVILEDDDIDDVTKTWGFCLVGYFTHRHPGKEALLRLCSSWSVPYDIIPDVNGWIVFKFRSEYDRYSVLRGAPYTIYDSLLIKVLPDWFLFGDDDMKKVPVWITFPQLPIECYNEKALGKIASCVGKPMTTDKITRTKQRVSYARVLVEIDASKDFVRSINVTTPSGISFVQKVEYEHEPTYCSNCNRIGHNISGCKRDKTPNLQQPHHCGEVKK